MADDQQILTGDDIAIRRLFGKWYSRNLSAPPGAVGGFSEDCSYQQQQFTDFTCPVRMLDNDFRNPDLNRYADRVFKHEPRVDTVGDAHDAAEAQMYVDAIRELEGSFPDCDREQRVDATEEADRSQIDIFRRLAIACQ